MNDQLGIVAFTLEDNAVNIPFNVGDRLGSYEFNVVFVVGADVDDGIGFRSEFISVDVVGLNGHIDGSGVAVGIVQHQGDVPLFALSATGL